MATVNPMAVVLVVLIVVPLIPLLTLGILAVRNVKNLSDPVRHGLIWFHCAIWFYFVSVLFNTILLGLSLSDVWTSSYGYQSQMAMSHFGGVATLIQVFGYLTLVMSIAHLAIGARQIDTQEQSPKYRIFMRVIIGLAAVLYAAYFIYSRYIASFRSQYYYSGHHYYDFPGYLAFLIIALVVVIFILIAAITTTVWVAIMAHRASKARKALRHGDDVGGYHFESTKALWGFIIASSSVSLAMAIWGLLNGVVPYMGGLVVDIFVTFWFPTVVLLLIYLAGKRTTNGLHSVPVARESNDKDSNVEEGAGVVL